MSWMAFQSTERCFLQIPPNAASGTRSYADVNDDDDDDDGDMNHRQGAAVGISNSSLGNSCCKSGTVL